VLPPPEFQQNLGPSHVILQDPAAVLQHGGLFPLYPAATLGTVKIDQDLRQEEVVPEDEESGTAATEAEAALVHAHGEISQSLFKVLPTKFQITSFPL
jgi:predicted class III extradiol MEMO1 family dioxygenase